MGHASDEGDGERSVHELRQLAADAGATVEALRAALTRAADHGLAALASAREAEARANRAEREARVMEDLSSTLSDLHDADAVAREVAVFVQGLLGEGSVVLAVAGREPDQLVRIGAREREEGGHRSRLSSIPVQAALPMAHAHRERTTLVFGSLEELATSHPEMVEEVRAAGSQAGICAPLLAGRRSLGVIGFGWTTPRRFTDEDRALLVAVARQAAGPLERAELLRKAQRETERVRFLAHAGELLASTLDVRETLATLARLAVPTLADWAAVDLFVGDRIERVAVAHSDPAKVELARTLVAKYPPSLKGADEPLARVHRSGQPELAPDIDDAMLVATSRDPDHLAILQTLGLRSYVAVPILSRDRVRGAFSLVAAESGRRHGPDDLELAMEIARRAALALEVSDVVDELRRAEREASTAWSRLELHLESSPMAVIELDRDLRVMRWSREAARVFGWTAEEMLGTPLDAKRWVHEEDSERITAAIGEMLSDATRRRVLPTRNHRKDGSVVWCEWYGSSVLDDEKHVASLLCLVLDVTDRVRAQQALEHADRRKDEFLAMLGHELRNPVGAIASAVEVLKLIGSPDPSQARVHAAIVRQVEHMRRLLDDLLDVARVSRGKLVIQRQPVDLRELVQHASDDCRAEIQRGGVDVGMHLEPLTVEGDPTRLAQIFANLLGNAIKFTPAGGRIDVSLRREDGQAVLEVRDTGIGIATETIDELFDPFVQASPTQDRTHRSLGLGLALVKGLTVLHGGSVEGHSEGPGRGARFLVRLPMASVPVDRELAREERPREALRVLVVEDDEDARDMLRLLLEALGQDVAVAADGPAAVEVARRHQPELVICDIGLPGAMDGYDVARALRSQPELRNSCLVALTGFGLPEHARRAQLAGFDRHVTKPIASSQLHDLLALGRARAAG